MEVNRRPRVPNTLVIVEHLLIEHAPKTGRTET